MSTYVWIRKIYAIVKNCNVNDCCTRCKIKVDWSKKELHSKGTLVRFIKKIQSTSSVSCSARIRYIHIYIFLFYINSRKESNTVPISPCICRTKRFLSSSVFHFVRDFIATNFIDLGHSSTFYRSSPFFFQWSFPSSQFVFFLRFLFLRSSFLHPFMAPACPRPMSGVLASILYYFLFFILYFLSFSLIRLRCFRWPHRSPVSLKKKLDFLLPPFRSILRYSFMRRFSAAWYRHFEIDFKRFLAPRMR